jgi:hypothetical protein
MIVIGVLGVIFGALYLLVAAKSEGVHKHNPGLYAAGAIAFLGGIGLILLEVL